MKPAFSLFCLYLRHTFWKVLLLLLAAGAAEWGLFTARWRALPYTPTLAEAYTHSLLPLGWVLAGVFGVLCLLLATATLARGTGQPGYTLRRLPLSRGQVLLGQGLWNTLAFLLFWGSQALVFLGMGWSFGQGGGFLNPQTLPTAVWQVPLFHAFLPLGDPLQWAGNLVLAGGLGFTAAAFTQALHRGKGIFAFPTLALCALVCLGSAPLSFLAAGGCLVWGLWQALRQEAPDRDDDNHRKEAAPHAPAETP